MSGDQNLGDVLLRTWVDVRYDKPLRVTGDPTITDSSGHYFQGGGSAYSYQFEALMKSS